MGWVRRNGFSTFFPINQKPIDSINQSNVTDGHTDRLTDEIYFGIEP